MALVTLPGGGWVVNPWPYLGNPSQATATMDAAGESHSIIGHICLSTGPGTSKVLSSAGGAIYWLPMTNTFANAGTNLRVGVNDIGAGRVEDGTHDVYADLVGGTDTLTSGTLRETAMETGTKTIAHGDLIAIVTEMTARGGTDSVTAAYWDALGITDQPAAYVANDTGSGPAPASVGSGIAMIRFDDGTYGWIVGTLPSAFVSTATNTGSTPDEYGTIFQVGFPTSVVGLAAVLDNIDTADPFELILYSDPLGVTPVAERTITPSPSAIISATADGLFRYPLTSAYTLTPGVDYMVAVRPTSANNINIFRLEFGTSHSALRVATMLGTAWRQGSRSNQTGAFAEDDTRLVCAGPVLGAFDDGAGSGGGLLRPVGLGGGLV